MEEEVAALRELLSAQSGLSQQSGKPSRVRMYLSRKCQGWRNGQRSSLPLLFGLLPKQCRRRACWRTRR